MSEEQMKLVRQAERCLKSLKYHEETLQKFLANAKRTDTSVIVSAKDWEYLHDEVEQMSEAFELDK